MRRIIVIEDDEELGGLIARYLDDGGHKVLSATGLTDGHALVEDADAFDLAIIDFWLDGQDCTSLLDALHARRPGIPVVVMTGGGDPAISIEATHAAARISGAQAFLQKPFRRQQLLSVVDELIGSR